MKPSLEIISFIETKEGCKLTAYKPLPTDRPTIGYGSTFYKDGSPVCLGDTIIQEEADELFSVKLNEFARRLSFHTPPNCTQQQFDAVLSLCYNIGMAAFLNSETGTLFSNGKDIAFKFGQWNKSGGKVVQGLIKRREEERRIYVEGIYS